MTKGALMVVAYAGLSLLCASISVLLLWSVSPVLAIFSAPSFGSAGVLLAGAYVALRRAAGLGWCLTRCQRAAGGATEVDLALVLAVDISRSMDATITPA